MSTAAELAYQTQQSSLALPAFPGALQTVPVQQASRRPSAGCEEFTDRELRGATSLPFSPNEIGSP